MKRWRDRTGWMRSGALTLGAIASLGGLEGCSLDTRDIELPGPITGTAGSGMAGNGPGPGAPPENVAGNGPGVIVAPGEPDPTDTVILPDGGLPSGVGMGSVGAACSEGVTACDGIDRLLVCVAGAFVEQELCAFACTVGEAGAACGGACEPGVRSCAADGTPQLCNDTGQVQPETPCAEPTPRCFEGECRVCAPNETRCNEAGLPEICGADGMTWTPGVACAGDNPVCVPETGGCGQCSPGSTRSCVGEFGNCAAGTQTCGGDNLWGLCSVLAAAADSCVPGDDADCDGQPNEGCDCTAPVACGPEQPQGICRAGTSDCVNGSLGVCQGAVFPAGRNCASAADNDCNGIADNTIDNTCQCAPNTSRACGQHPGQDGIGICSAGQQTCIAAAGNLSSNFGACVGSVGPRARDCRSNLDNDCNGTPDNRIDNVCQCVPGEQRDCGIEAGSRGCSRGTQTCQLVNGNTQSQFGACVFNDVAPGTACDDGDAQTAGDSCQRGTCAGTRIGTLATGEGASCAIRSGGALYCWGSGTFLPATDSPPTQIDLPGQAVSVSVGGSHGCAVLSDGTLHCFGANGLGTLGNGTITDVTTGSTPVNLRSVVQVATNTNNTAAVLIDGSVLLWGATVDGPTQPELYGPVAPTDTPFIAAPFTIAQLGQVSSLGLGSRHACAVLGSSQTVCWGRNDFSQLGIPPSTFAVAQRTTALVNTPGSDDAISASAGDSYSCVLRSGGLVACWGSIFSGDLDPAESINAPPAQVSGLTGATQLSVGSSSACALRNDGTVACWGGNAFGELGTGSFVGTLTAQPVSNLTDAVLLSSASALGGRSVCALRRTGAVVCWGANDRGQLGDGTTTNRTTPVAVQGLPN